MVKISVCFIWLFEFIVHLWEERSRKGIFKVLITLLVLLTATQLLLFPDDIRGRKVSKTSLVPVPSESEYGKCLENCQGITGISLKRMESRRRPPIFNQKIYFFFGN